MAVEDWLPSVADVAALVPQRTGTTAAGGPVGTFNAETVPTDSQVNGLIAGVGDEVAGYAGDVPEALWSQAGRVVALGAASLVELSFYPDQQAVGETVDEKLDARYSRALDRLRGAVGDLGAGEEVGEADRANVPTFKFPEVPTVTDTTTGTRAMTWNERW